MSSCRLMSRWCVVLICCIIAAGLAYADDERGVWRVSIGPSAIGSFRSRISADYSAMSVMSGFSRFIGSLGAVAGGRTRADALADGNGSADPNGVRRFDGGAWYDPKDSASASDPEWSWNWRLHDPQGADPAGRKGFVEYTGYSELNETRAVTLADGGGTVGDSSGCLPGLHIELARELYRSDDERPWGVDVDLGFSWFLQNGFWNASGTAAKGAVDGRLDNGRYEWWNDSDDTAQYILDYNRDTQFSDGMWGVGSFDGPGAELSSSAWKYRDVPDSSEHWSASHVLGYHGDGDYQEFAFELVARPWWEPYDWLRIFGSLGMELSRRSFDWSVTVRGSEGSYFSESGEASDWSVAGLVGGGVSLRWRDFTLTGEGLWRFGGDGLEIDGRTVRGEIEHGDWYVRLLVGYEF